MTRLGADAVVALIPARGGSRGVPRKNVLPVGGVPLVARAVAAARTAGIDAVWVTTDDAEIAAVARAAGAGVIDRPADLAAAAASSESALLHALETLAADGVDPRVTAFLQATSPFIDAAALRRAVDRVLGGEADSVLAAFPTYAFLWQQRPDGTVAAVNHDAAARPRRQDREPHLQETGAFYALRTRGFLAARFRFFGRVAAEPVAEVGALEIDDPEQLRLARRIAPEVDDAVRGLPVDALITDFDGVHTDDTAEVDANGLESVRVSRADGLGVERLRRAGVPVLILSKERNPVVAARAAKLRIPVQQAVDDKVSAVAAWCAEHDIDPARVAYVGNDLNDLGVFDLVGWPIAPADAIDEVRLRARLVLDRRGGHGAVRQVAELILAGGKDHE